MAHRAIADPALAGTRRASRSAGQQRIGARPAFWRGAFGPARSAGSTRQSLGAGAAHARHLDHVGSRRAAGKRRSAHVSKTGASAMDCCAARLIDTAHHHPQHAHRQPDGLGLARCQRVGRRRDMGGVRSASDSRTGPRRRVHDAVARTAVGTHHIRRDVVGAAAVEQAGARIAGALGQRTPSAPHPRHRRRAVPARADAGPHGHGVVGARGRASAGVAAARKQCPRRGADTGLGDRSRTASGHTASASPGLAGAVCRQARTGARAQLHRAARCSGDDGPHHLGQRTCPRAAKRCEP